MTNEENYSIPANVKQIGTISDKTSRIYVEDYVCTYIDQYAKAEPLKEKIAILIGKKINVDGDDALFISGVIQGRFTIKKNGMTELTEKSWQYVKKQISLYFDGLNVVGWIYVQPGFEDYIGDSICSFQKNNRARGLQVLYIVDPTENVSSFYKWNNENMMFSQIKGYVIYYEKNEGMHEYMLENKIKSPKPDKTEVKKDAGAEARAAAKSVFTNKRSKYRSGLYKSNIKVSKDSKKLINLLGGVSFIMLMVCFVMGARIVQSDERLSNLEDKLMFIEASLNESQGVFASQPVTEQPTVQTVQTTSAQTTIQQTTQSQTKKYVVQPGDTLIKIAKKVYGNVNNINKIKELNNIDGNTIVVGKTLILP